MRILRVYNPVSHRHWTKNTEKRHTGHAALQPTYDLKSLLFYRLSGHARMILRRRILPDIKGKALPLQVWTGPEGSRRLKLPDFKTIGTFRW